MENVRDAGMIVLCSLVMSMLPGCRRTDPPAGKDDKHRREIVETTTVDSDIKPGDDCPVATGDDSKLLPTDGDAPVSALGEQKETMKNSEMNVAEGFSASESPTLFVDILMDSGAHIVLELDADAAPITVANFQKLVGEKFYDGIIFHRIIAGFMIQGGDPDGIGTGGSGENIKGEFAERRR